MARTDAIPVGPERAGDAAGPTVELPVRELLSGWGLVTGAAAADRAGTARLIAGGILDRGHPLLVVDRDGTYADLGRREGAVHAGADDGHDRQVGVDAAETLAALALERGVPVVLDVASFPDERAARSLLTALAEQLLATARRVDRPLPVFLPAFHELVPAGDATDECGRSLHGLARCGPEHGCGVVAISARPARVRSAYIDRCDWQLWHRHPRRSDSAVADRRLGPVDRELVEVLDRGEAYLQCEWESRVRKVSVESGGNEPSGATVDLGAGERPRSTHGIADGGGPTVDGTATAGQYERRIRDLERSLQAVTERLQTIERSLADGTDPVGAEMGATDQDHQSTRGTNAAADTPADDTDDDLFGVDPGALTGDSDDSDPDSPGPDGSGPAETAPPETTSSSPGPSSNTSLNDGRPGGVRPEERKVVRRLRETIAGFDHVTRGMLAYYREYGPASPVDAHVAAGVDADRTVAYRRNGAMREADLIEHAGRGGYTDRLRAAVVEAHDDRLDSRSADAAVDAVVAELPAPNPRAGEDSRSDGNGGW